MLLNIPILLTIFLGCSKIVAEIRYVSHKNCNNVKKGIIIANPGNCSQYIMCNGLRSTLGECPEGQYFNEQMLSCDKNSIKCRENVSTNTATNLKEKDNETYKEFLHSLRLNCLALKNFIMAHPYNCGYYYECLEGNLSVKRCPLGLSWHWRKERCVAKGKAVCFSHN